MTVYSCPFLQDHACGNPNHPSVVVEESRMTVGYHKGMDAEGIKSIYLTGYKLLLYEYK